MNLYLNIQYILTFVGMIGSFFLGLIVLSKDYKKWQNISFFSFTTGLALWSLFMVLHNITGNLLLGRLIFAPVPLVAFSIWAFSYHFPVSQKKLFDKVWKYIALYLGLPISTSIGITPLVLKDVRMIDGVLYPIKGFLMNYYYAFFLVVFVFSIINLLRKYFISSKENQLKMQYLTLGLAGTIFFMILFLVVLPELLGTYKQAFFAPAFSLVLVGFTAYSILKRRLWSLQHIIAEILLYLLISILGIGVYRVAMLVHDLYLRSMNLYLRLMIEMLMGLSLGPLFLFLVEKTRRFLAEKISSRKWAASIILEKLEGITEREIKLDKLTDFVFPYLQKMLLFDSIDIIIWDKSEAEIIYCKGYPKNHFLEAELNVSKLTKLWKSLAERSNEGNVFSYADLDEKMQNQSDVEILEILGIHKHTTLSKLFLQSDLLGLIVWKEDSDERALTLEDYELLEKIGSLLGLSLSRSLLYQQIADFNANLQIEIEKATAELESANKELRQLDKAKDDLISIASHELRTPATIVKGKLYLLKGRLEKLKGSKEYDERIESDVDVCLSAIEREIEQVNTLLEASRIGKDTMVLDKQLYDISLLVESAVDEFQEMAKMKHIDLLFEETSKEFPFVNIDVRRMREVIDNLITNAIKYTNDGFIKVKVFQKSAKDVCVSISDTGVGIPADKIDKLFSKFYRVKNDADVKTSLVKPGGTGLGLYVAKNIIEKHDGKIWVESEFGKGSIFTFCIPVKRKG